MDLVPMDCLYIVLYIDTYLGRIVKYPEEVWVVCKRLLDALYSAGDVRLSQRNDLDSHCE